MWEVRQDLNKGVGRREYKRVKPFWAGGVKRASARFLKGWRAGKDTKREIAKFSEYVLFPTLTHPTEVRPL